MHHKRLFKHIFIAITALFFFTINGFAQEAIPTDEAAIAQGQTLFEENCTVCHAVHSKVIGPALQNVYNRRPIPWIQAFVKNSQKVIQSGDEYAVKLYAEYNNTEMTSFSGLSDEQILSIVAYIKQQTDEGPAVVETTTGDVGAGAVAGQSGVSETYMNAIVIGLVVILVLILIVLVLIVSFLVRFLNLREDLSEADKEVVGHRLNFGALVKSPVFIGFVAFFFVAIVAKVTLDNLYTVGVQQGYAPTQPIAFSHKLHAGTNEIDCNYCHTGVRKSKSANIPSPNICMNCHSQIKTESPEIQKIYAAIETNTPIKWIRIHNLPDLAFFSHQQHVAVGNIECQTCHGEIQEMEVVQQYAPLTMGWCISCHRETDVDTKGNAYYDKLVQLHEEKGEGSVLKVEDIGGLECSKCHY